MFLAPSDAIFAAAVRRFEEFLHLPVIEIKYSEDKIEGPEYHASLLTYPAHGSFLEKVLHIILLPSNALMHFMIPDVRKASIAPFTKALISTILSILFLTIVSLIMVEALEAFAEKLEIPESIVGATISAAATSFPILVASQIAARQGLGNMAISNVFGSNTFNINVALGLPWLLYATLNEGYYSELSEEGITESMFVMAAVLLIFIVLMICTKFHLHLWHAYFFVALYILYILRCITLCFD